MERQRVLLRLLVHFDARRRLVHRLHLERSDRHDRHHGQQKRQNQPLVLAKDDDVIEQVRLPGHLRPTATTAGGGITVSDSPAFRSRMANLMRLPSVPRFTHDLQSLARRKLLNAIDGDARSDAQRSLGRRAPTPSSRRCPGRTECRSISSARRLAFRFSIFFDVQPESDPAARLRIGAHDHGRSAFAKVVSPCASATALSTVICSPRLCRTYPPGCRHPDPQYVDDAGTRHR